MKTDGFHIKNSVGRLVEVRVTTLHAPEDVKALGASMGEVVGRVAGPVAICADYRETRLLTQPIADAFLAILTTFNPRIERSGLLLSGERATFNLQLERLVREAGYTSRRTFRVAPELAAWLGEVLTVEERTRVSAFLASG
jgi:hypothetical protein